MKKTLFTSVVLVGFLSGCFAGGGGYGGGRHQGQVYTPASTSSVPSVSTLPSSVRDSLKYMYEEERLAKEVYLSIYQRQPVMQLERIATRSETRHIDAVNSLARKYGVRLYAQTPGRYSIPAIQSLYNTLYSKGIRSRKDALEVGCMVEVTDIDDLNRYIYDAQNAGAYDIVQTYEFLRKGSYNHYWAFDRGLKQIGVSSGCCSLGQKYCHPEYPQNQRGQGRGKGMGRGQGRGHGMGMGRW